MQKGYYIQLFFGTKISGISQFWPLCWEVTQHQSSRQVRTEHGVQVRAIPHQARTQARHTSSLGGCARYRETRLQRGMGQQARQLRSKARQERGREQRGHPAWS